MHKLSFIHIKNFRSCRDISLPLGDFTPLVGQNNVGKSTILDAIKTVLTPKAFAKTDFSKSDEPISISACIDGISAELLASIPNDKHRSAIEKYCVNERLWIRITGTGTAKPVQEVWEVEKYAKEGLPEHWRAYPTGLPQAVSVLLPEALHIVAMEDLSEDLGKAKAGSTIKGLLDEIMDPIVQAHAELKGALDAVRNILGKEGETRSPHLKNFDEGATTALSEFFPGLALDMDLPSVDIKEFFKSGDLHVTDEITEDRRRFDQLGSGAQRAIQMALVRYLADIRQGNEPNVTRRMLLIDEPELYLHPQGVRRLREALRTLSQVGFQVVFSTHSPLMLSRENAPDTVIVTRTAADGAIVKQPLREAVRTTLTESAAQAQTLFQLGNISEIYFCEKVILCEGKTDQRLLPLVYERLYGRLPELDKICFVSLGGCANIPKGLPVLAVMGITGCAIADLDFAFTHARKGSNAWLSKDSKDIEQTKLVLARLSGTHGYPLSPDGMPTTQGAMSASGTWSIFAQDKEGEGISNQVHESLKVNNVWVWPAGCIEDITKCDQKGEDAIIKQEEQLSLMSAQDIEGTMPELKHCLDWVRSL